MRMKRIVTTAVLALLLTGLCACSKGVIKITDRDISTEIEVSLPKTVDKILQEAEVTLNDGDEISPAVDTKITEPVEIIISRKNTVKLTVDGDTREVVIIGGTVKDLLKQEGITLAENQHVNQSEDTVLTDGMEVRIDSLFRVTLTHDGQTEEEEVEARKVSDVLADFKVELGADDRVEPAADTEITDGMEITVSRVTFKEENETEEIDFETVREDDNSLAKGTEQVSVEGVKGERTRTYKITLVDGKEESREVLSEEVTKEPVNEVIKVGTYEEPESSGSEESSGDGGVTVVRTEYYPACAPNIPDDYIVYYSDHTYMSVVHDSTGAETYDYGTW